MYKLIIGPQRYFDAAEVTNRQQKIIVGSIGKAYNVVRVFMRYYLNPSIQKLCIFIQLSWTYIPTKAKSVLIHVMTNLIFSITFFCMFQART